MFFILNIKSGENKNTETETCFGRYKTATVSV